MPKKRSYDFRLLAIERDSIDFDPAQTETDGRPDEYQASRVIVVMEHSFYRKPHLRWLVSASAKGRYGSLLAALEGLLHCTHEPLDDESMVIEEVHIYQEPADGEDRLDSDNWDEWTIEPESPARLIEALKASRLLTARRRATALSVAPAESDGGARAGEVA